MTTNPIPEPSDELVLKPCPWCATAWIKVQRDNPACFCAECQECAVLGPEADTYDGAIAAWNTRAAIAAMPELTELQEEQANLIHDLERSMDTANHYVNESERFRETLEKISDHETSSPCRTCAEAILTTLNEIQSMASAALAGSSGVQVQP